MDPAYKGLGVNPFSTSNGVLDIHAARSSATVEAATGYDYTSGMISSKSAFAQTYGYFEIKCQLPDEKGAWPAFWLLPADSTWPPELDVFEVLGDNPNKVYTTVHTMETGTHTGTGQGTLVSDLSVGMHTYGVLWTQSDVVWFVDGEEIFRAPTPSDMNKPMYMIANLAIGGYWPGSPDASFTSADMKIDYIKAYSLDGLGTGTQTALPTTGTASRDVFTVTALTDEISDGYIGDGDLVNASVSYTLPDSVENLTLTGTVAINATGNSQNNVLTGNSVNNSLTGLGGDDTLDGRGGADTMTGGTGNDTYFVDSIGDRVIELAAQGIDTVRSVIGYYLGANVENLIVEGTANRGIGNGLNNVITGNSADNYLAGGDGSDTLTGNGGNDCLWGGAGADTMKGGTGNDTYNIDDIGDRVTEAYGQGIDAFNSRISFVLGDNIERLNLSGTAWINGTGNGLDNLIDGNAGNNLLQGGAGKDTLVSNGGRDVFSGGTGADSFVFNAAGTLKISDFGAGNEADRLIISSSFKSGTGFTLYNDAMGSAHVHFVDGSDILLQGVKVADLSVSGNVITA